MFQNFVIDKPLLVANHLGPYQVPEQKQTEVAAFGCGSSTHLGHLEIQTYQQLFQALHRDIRIR
jgi:hypothetical protein